MAKGKLILPDLISKLSGFCRDSFELNGTVRENAIWLPRLGFEFELPDK